MTAGEESKSSNGSDSSDDAPIQNLARSFSMTRTRSELPPSNPFDSDDPRLDPKSPNFNPERWVKAMLHAFSQDPDRFPRHTAGVSWRNLNVYGTGSGEYVEYQKDVLNVLWNGPRMIMDWFQSRSSKVKILDGFDGMLKSGELVLVLGRPGSGVSTFLKTIAGHTHGLHVDPDSEFNYQGIPWDMMHRNFRGEVVYQAETDIHFPQLTVGQTLLFAALARTPSNRISGASRHEYAEHLRDAIMAMFGIARTINTKVGNDFIRGVSGGERKRVSIAEAVLNQSAIQCWDNSTRGLDSATALEFIKTLRLGTELGGTSAMVALYQASELAYNEFDKVMVLYEGRQIFFGSAKVAKKYFTDMGYHCPSRQTTADFLTSLTNMDERIVEAGYESKVPKTPDEFADHWRMSQHRSDLLGEIATFENQFPLNGAEVQKLRNIKNTQKAKFMSKDSPFTISVPMQIRLCMTRGFQRLMGDKTFFIVTILGNLFMALIAGSVYFDISPTADEMDNRCRVLFISILFNGLSSALEILALYAQRPIVEKQARYALYRPLSEAFSSIICDLPSKILSAIAFNLPLYFMVNFRRDAGNFFIFMLFSFTMTLTMSMLLRTIAQASKTIHQALVPATLMIIGLIIYTGYVLPTRAMMGWLRWLNYIDPIAYAYEALVANEFHNRQFPCGTMIPMGPPYANATATEQTCSIAGALPGENFVDGDFFISAAYGYEHSHIWRNFGILVAFLVFFSFTYVMAAELLASSPSKGEVLVFRKGLMESKAPKKGGQDEEKTDSHATTSLPRAHDRNSTTTLAATAKSEEQRPINFFWKDLCYNIEIKGEPRRLLNNVNGWVQPGKITALMGASGAGKTTLLDVLADRVTMGVVTGDAHLNGLPRGKSFQRNTGYVQQQDIHLETSTVREALRFSAELRQPHSVSIEEKHEYVEEIIELLEMKAYADAVVGIQGEGLNVEQRKRLSIGVELVAKPEALLFLDEPTSGLDSQTAWAITSLITKLSNHGQAILCTIHQPSAILFQQFDRLLLLASGGNTVYFSDIGDHSKTMTGYFEQFGASPCRDEENPAEWMLHAIGAAPGAHTDRDWAQTWLESNECAAIKSQIETLMKPAAQNAVQAPSGSDDDSYAAPFLTQYIACTKRVTEQYWRTPTYIYSKLCLTFGTSLFVGLSFQDSPLSLQGLQNQMFSIFMLLVAFAFLTYQTMPNFVLQRDLYEGREKSSKTYGWYVFILANVTIESVWNSLAAVFIFLPFYFLVGMYNNGKVTDTEHERAVLMFLLLWGLMVFEGTFSEMCVSGAPTAEVGATFALILFMMTLVFAGVLVPYATLPGFWHFMYRVSPMTYMVSALLSVGTAKQAIECSSIEFLTMQPPANTTCGEYLGPFMQLAGGALENPQSTESCMFCPMAETDAFLSTVVISYDDRWRNFGFIWVYTVFNIFAALSFYWLARVPKQSLWQMLKLSRK